MQIYLIGIVIIHSGLTHCCGREELFTIQQVPLEVSPCTCLPLTLFGAVMDGLLQIYICDVIHVLVTCFYI